MLDTRSDILKKMKVMYVEDDLAQAEAVEFSFNKMVRELSISPTAENALEIYDTFNPDIVITDIALPFMNGIELARELKEKNPDTVVIVVSGHKDEEYLLGSIEARVDCYVTKPVNMRCLRDHLYSAAEKIDEKRKMENSRNFVKKVMDSSKEMYLVGCKGKINYVNGTLLEYLGFADLENLNTAILQEEMLTVVEKSGTGRVISFRYWLMSVCGIDGYEGIISLLRPTMLKSDARSWMVRVNRLVDEDMFVITFVDVTVMEKQKQLFHNMAMTDPLTEIYNRYKFFEELAKETERSKRYGKEYSLIMFDIDRFKLINDTFGHQIGDSVLKELGRMVGGNLRKSDVFARYGGEEFIILTPETDSQSSAILAEKLKDLISSMDFCHVGHVTCSFGVAQHKGVMSGEDVVKLADDALYTAKSMGRNRVEITQ